jgi:hypothetical protein
MKVFVPISDEMLEKGILPDDMVAYRPDLLVLSQLQTTPDQSKSSDNRSPTPTPNSSAIPALSSNTY